ncbi:MAG: type 4a pilus biogenesis protein PilO [Bdellovibrionales bacterium]|nr:type 4a pilus biogenesis protein PilO [Bdellovibrionales bacterium]
MNDVIKGILERPTGQKVGIIVGVLVFSTYIFWQYFYKKPSEDLQSHREQIETLESKILTEKRLARNLDKVRQQVKELDEKLAFALQELPDKREIDDLLSSISDLASDAGLEVSLFKPLPENKRDFYAEVPVSITVAGTFHQIATFFDEVGQLPRIVNIDEITIREPDVKEAAVRVRADCTATTFRYLDESERVKPKDDKKRRR